MVDGDTVRLVMAKMADLSRAIGTDEYTYSDGVAALVYTTACWQIYGIVRVPDAHLADSSSALVLDECNGDQMWRLEANFSRRATPWIHHIAGNWYAAELGVCL
jgi:hypothetical protein